jgi:hypothetical protein
MSASVHLRRGETTPQDKAVGFYWAGADRRICDYKPGNNEKYLDADPAGPNNWSYWLKLAAYKITPVSKVKANY